MTEEQDAWFIKNDLKWSLKLVTVLYITISLHVLYIFCKSQIFELIFLFIRTV